MKYSKNQIIKLTLKTAQLGMRCSFTEDALKNNVPINELREQFEIDCRLIREAINDLSIIVG